MRLFFALAPLLLFYAVESAYGLKSAIVAGVAAALVEAAWARWAEGRVPRLTLLSLVLIAGLGGISLASDDPAFALLAPGVGDMVLAALIASVQLRGSNVLLVAVREQEPDLDPHPLQVRFLDGLAWRLAGNLSAHAVLVAWAAGQSTETWLLVSGPVQYAMLGAQVAAEVAWGRLVVLPRVEAEERGEA